MRAAGRALVFALACDMARSSPCQRVSYTAGRQEGRWINGKVSGHICSMAWKEVENRDSMKWLEYAATMNNGNEARDPTEDEARVLSHFQCADGSTEYIEPLTGVARHPFARVGCKRASKDWTSGLPSEYPKGVDIINSSYLVLPNACNSKQARRALFFDMGCGIDRGNAKSYNKTKDGDQPDSIVKFADMFAARCIHFDRIFAWEKKPYAAEEWWGSKPPELRSKLTFFNLGVPQEPTQGASSFLRLLNATVRPSDYVVVKLDIDTPHVELSIVRALIADATLASLVDELFFEYHFYEDYRTGWYFGWFFTPLQIRSAPTVDDALALMQRLRALGIRAHFWT